MRLLTHGYVCGTLTTIGTHLATTSTQTAMVSPQLKGPRNSHCQHGSYSVTVIAVVISSVAAIVLECVGLSGQPASVLSVCVCVQALASGGGDAAAHPPHGQHDDADSACRRESYACPTTAARRRC